MGTNKKQLLNFCYGFFGMLIVMGGIYIWDRVVSTSYMGILSMLGSILMAALGCILWAIVRIKNKSLAIGFLLGGMVPFMYIFFMTGGCGIFL
ncbi:MAG: hypothetical protein Q8882_05105 [Bacillota bacterium]|nr:hypothetical protein [Bacillota bacterium]